MNYDIFSAVKRTVMRILNNDRVTLYFTENVWTLRRTMLFRGVDLSYTVEVNSSSLSQTEELTLLNTAVLDGKFSEILSSYTKSNITMTVTGIFDTEGPPATSPKSGQ